MERAMITLAPCLGLAAKTEADALHAAEAHAPYLAQLRRNRPETFTALAVHGYAAALRTAFANVDAVGLDEDILTAMALLRQAKADMHLILAGADLALRASLEEVTGALSAFADVALRAALRVANAAMLGDGDLTAPADHGFSIVAMGKHGAGELNYSSDIDLIVFFAPNWLHPGRRLDARQAAVKLTQGLVRVMQEVTADGYVFRIDLRLRPDPASTPVAVSFAAAERYYQSVGENWERAAFIKARACAGDIEMAEAFLASLRPFLWRRHLDYAAIDDIRAVQRQIHRFHGSAPLDQPAFDVKLGRGGIRDIELFVQTQQLILGGRAPQMRARATLEALAALEQAQVVAPEDAAVLANAYRAWRAVEHRIQMRADEQTHALPSDTGARAAVAALCGYGDLDRFDGDVIAQRQAVAAICAPEGGRTMGLPHSLAKPQGSSVDVDTILTDPRFAHPGAIRARLENWQTGSVRALRTPRARGLWAGLAPRVLSMCLAQNKPDDAFASVGDFLDRLSGGVQVLALLEARADVLAALVRLLAIAPRLASDLAQRPTLIDAMGEARFFAPAGEASGARLRQLQAIAAAENGFEAVINAVRRFQREDAFRTTALLLTRAISPRAAGHAFAELAEACVSAVADAALSEVERQYGRAPGRHCVIALGKFAGGELSAHSDLDVMVVYDALDGARSSGARDLSAGDFYARFAQRLISGLSAPTEEGLLYKIDVQLRPSGAKGPVAVRLSSFARYYAEEAWTWELMALTRARVVTGEASISADCIAAVRAALATPRTTSAIQTDAAAMRGRLDQAKRSYGPFDLKHAPGGMIDVEFIAQTLSLMAQGQVASPIPSTAQSLSELARVDRITRAQEGALRTAFDLYTDLQQILRAAAREPWDPPTAPAGLQALLCAAAGVPDVEGLAALLTSQQHGVRLLFQTLVGEPGDGTAALSR
jgi:[glutamine synthetase] adenylyltransferase / [glutamine synthetase]-adenylyl-L-tyrosine phosphorylase